MVCIIDDRDDVWQGCLNLVQVKPYHFFLNTGDINVPPGLGKHDDPCPPKSLTEQALNEGKITLENGEDSNAAKSTASSSSSNTEDTDNSKTFKKVSIDLEKKPDKTELKIIEKEKENEIASKKYDCSEEKKEAEASKGTKNTDSASENKLEVGKKKDDKLDFRSKKKHKTDKLQDEGDEESLDNGEDQDDYLLYLEDILKRIHTEFYNEKGGDPKTKTLKDIIPKVRSRVLDGLCITFSGLVPNNQRLPDSRAYKVARAFGAQVTQVNVVFLVILTLRNIQEVMLKNYIF